MSVAVFATVSPKPEHLAEAVSAIEAILAETQAENGCLQFTLHRGMNDGKIHLYEIWADQAAFDNHHAQPYTQAVYRQYEAWLTAPVEITFMQPIA